LSLSAATFTNITPFVITITVATTGWIFTYFHSRHQYRRQAQLELINKKLRLLYGPLYARLLAGNAAWAAFSKTKWPKHRQGGYFTEGFPLSDNEITTWRNWMKIVFHPMNKKLEGIIVENLDLLEDDEIPRALTKALAHIYVYDAVLAAWEDGDFSEHTSIINFPAKELLEIVEPAYRNLRGQQALLSKA
jgi:hypothetical protein